MGKQQPKFRLLLEFCLARVGFSLPRASDLMWIHAGLMHSSNPNPKKTENTKSKLQADPFHPVTPLLREIIIFLLSCLCSKKAFTTLLEDFRGIPHFLDVLLQ